MGGHKGAPATYQEQCRCVGKGRLGEVSGVLQTVRPIVRETMFVGACIRDREREWGMGKLERERLMNCNNCK